MTDKDLETLRRLAADLRRIYDRYHYPSLLGDAAEELQEIVDEYDRLNAKHLEQLAADAEADLRRDLGLPYPDKKP